jgi:hypothetical protein
VMDTEAFNGTETAEDRMRFLAEEGVGMIVVADTARTLVEWALGGKAL